MSDPVFPLRAVGHVSSPLRDRADAPKQGNEGAPAAWLVFDPQFAEALTDLQVGEEILVLTWLDRGDRDTLRVHPRGDTSVPMRGVFSYLTARLEGEKYFGNGRAMKNRHLAMPAFRRVRFGTQFIQSAIQIENVAFSGKSLSGMRAQSGFLFTHAILHFQLFQVCLSRMRESVFFIVALLR